MNFFPNAKESSAAKEAPDRYAAYMGEYQELFRRYGVGFGRAEDFIQLFPTLGRDEQFRIDFETLTRTVRDREEGRLTLTQMLTIIAVAIGGSQVLSTRGLNTVPVVMFLKRIGEWNGMGGDTESIVNSARMSVSPEIEDRPTTETRADDGREAKENGWFSAEPRGQLPTVFDAGVTRRGGLAASKSTEPSPPRDALSRLEWALKMGPEGSGDKREPEFSAEPEAVPSGARPEAQTIGDGPDHFRSALDHGWFSVESVESKGEPLPPPQDAGESAPGITGSSSLAPDVMSRLELALKLGSESLDLETEELAAPLSELRSGEGVSTPSLPLEPRVDDLTSRANSTADLTATKPGKIERVDSRVSKSFGPKYGEIATVAPAVPQVSRDVASVGAGIAKNTDATARNAASGSVSEENKSTSGEEDDPKQTKFAAMAALGEVVDLMGSSRAGKLFAVGAIAMAVLLPVMVIGVIVHREQSKDEVTQEEPAEASVVAEPGADASVGKTARSRNSARVTVTPKGTGRGGKAQAERDGRRGGAEAGDWMTITGGVHEPQIGVDQAQRIPTLAGSPAKIHAGQAETPPTIAEGQAGPDIDVGPVSWLANLKGNEKIQVTVHQSEPVPVENAPAKIHYGKADVPPAIADGEMAKGTPAVVANAKAPPAPQVTMARVEGSPGVGAAGPGGADMAAVTGGGASAGSSGVVNGNAKKSKKKKVTVHPSVGVSTGLLGSYLVKYSVPSYPRAAKKQKLEGDVLVRVLISEKGKIEKAVALNGPPQLRSAVEKTVRKWRYKPYILNGRPVEVQTWVTFHFALTES